LIDSDDTFNNLSFFNFFKAQSKNNADIVFGKHQRVNYKGKKIIQITNNNFLYKGKNFLIKNFF
jgi:hypothetical protein